MQVGDVITEDQLPSALDALPVRAVAVCDDSDHVNVVIRTADGFDWYGRGGRTSHYGEVFAGNWTVVHLPVPVLKVGDTVTSEGQAKALPIGSVVVDTTDAAPHRAAAIKVGDDKWLFEGVLPSGPQHCSDADVYGDGEDVVVYIPEVAA